MSLSIANGTGTLFLCFENDSEIDVVISNYPNNMNGLSAAISNLLPNASGLADNYQRNQKKIFLYSTALATDYDYSLLPNGSVDITDIFRPISKSTAVSNETVNVSNSKTQYDIPRGGQITNVVLNPTSNASIAEIVSSGFYDGDIIILHPSDATFTIEINNSSNIKLATESFSLKPTASSSIDRSIMLLRGDFGAYEWMEISRNQVFSPDDIIGSDVTVPSGETYFYTKDSSGTTAFTPLSDSSVLYSSFDINFSESGAGTYTLGYIPANSIVMPRGSMIRTTIAANGTAIGNLKVGGNTIIASTTLANDTLFNATGVDYINASGTAVYYFSSATAVTFEIASGSATRLTSSFILPYIKL